MKYLIKQATVIEPTSVLHQQVLDILIHDGKITAIAPNIPSEDALILTFPNLHISIGWLDIGVQTGEPGLEQREDLQSVTQAAASGGFTAIALFPNTQPVVHSRTDVLFLEILPSTISLIYSLSVQLRGIQMAKIFPKCMICTSTAQWRFQMVNNPFNMQA